MNQITQVGLWLGISALQATLAVAQEPLVELKIDLPRGLATFEGRPAVPADAAKFVVPGPGRARFTYSGDPMVEEYQIFGVELSFPGSANAYHPGRNVESNVRDRKNVIGQPFVWIDVQEFTAEQTGMEVNCVLKPRFNYQSATGQSYPAQSALFRVEWLGDGPGGVNDAFGGIVGVWQHGDGGETWTFIPNADGTFKAVEQGFGNARGTATVSENKIHIDYTCPDGTSGEYDIVLAPDKRTGRGQWTSDLPDSGIRNFTKLGGTATDNAPPPAVDPDRLTLLVTDYDLQAGETRWLPVEIRNPSNVSNLNLQVEFDANVVLVQGKPRVGTAAGQRLFETNFSEPGLVRLGWAGPVGIPQDGVVAEIPVTAVGQPGARTSIQLRVTDANGADGQALSAQTQSGSVTILAPTPPADEVGQPAPPVVPPTTPWTTVDALQALQMSVKLLTEDNRLDLDKDGQVTSNDARLILQQALIKGP